MQIERPGAVQLKWSREERLPEPGTAAIERRVRLCVRVASGAVTSLEPAGMPRQSSGTTHELRQTICGNLSGAAADRPNDLDGGC
jgi:hypothetical protein